MSGRERGPNYSNDEKITLLNIIKQYKNVIECKKTDTVSWKDKEIAWNNITNKFNAASPNFVKRSKQSIQKFYENKKKKIRKAVALQRNEMLKTGGGSATPKLHDPTEDIILDIINKKTVIGLNNNFDGDSNNFLVDSSIVTNDEEVRNVISPVIENDLQTNLEQVDLQECPNNCETNINESSQKRFENLDTSEPCTTTPRTNHNEQFLDISWGNHSAKQLKIPVSKKLREQSETWIPRRRPTDQTSHSSHLSKQYSDLAKVKLELAKLQKDAFIADTKARQEREKIEFELKKENLELDIKIKKVQLKKLNCEL